MLKPFDLEAALRGDPVITRGSLKVVEIYLFKSDIDRPLVALIERQKGLADFDINGKHTGYEGENFDLFMAPKTKKLWIAINMCENFNEKGHHTSCAYESLEHLRSIPLYSNYIIKEIEVEV